MLVVRMLEDAVFEEKLDTGKVLDRHDLRKGEIVHMDHASAQELIDAGKAEEHEWKFPERVDFVQPKRDATFSPPAPQAPAQQLYPCHLPSELSYTANELHWAGQHGDPESWGWHCDHCLRSVPGLESFGMSLADFLGMEQPLMSDQLASLVLDVKTMSLGVYLKLSAFLATHEQEELTQDEMMELIFDDDLGPVCVEHCLAHLEYRGFAAHRYRPDDESRPPDFVQPKRKVWRAIAPEDRREQRDGEEA